MSESELTLALIVGVLWTSFAVIVFIFIPLFVKRAEPFLPPRWIRGFLCRTSPENSYLRERGISRLDSLWVGVQKFFVVFVRVVAVLMALAGIFFIFLVIMTYLGVVIGIFK